MKADDIQQIGRVISVLTTCLEKLETIMSNSGEGTDAYKVADNAAEWVSYSLDEVTKCVTFTPTKQFK